MTDQQKKILHLLLLRTKEVDKLRHVELRNDG